MAKSRASIFEDEGQKLDVGSFAPKTAIDTKAPRAEEVREVSQAAQFRSREPGAPNPKAPSKRAPRIHRTGRNVQFNIKASMGTVDTFYSITDKQGWVLGETLERAVEALQRELEKRNG